MHLWQGPQYKHAVDYSLLARWLKRRRRRGWRRSKNVAAQQQHPSERSVLDSRRQSRQEILQDQRPPLLPTKQVRFNSPPFPFPSTIQFPKSRFRILILLFFAGMTPISTRFSRCTPSYGSFSRRIGRNWWKRGWSDGRLARSRRESDNCISGSTWGPVTPITYWSRMCSMRRYWLESISRRVCFRMWILLTSNCGSSRGFSWCVWFWTGGRWCTSWLISLKYWLMNARGLSRSP